jgi:hypothetical protein
MGASAEFVAIGELVEPNALSRSYERWVRDRRNWDVCLSRGNRTLCHYSWLVI